MKSRMAVTALVTGAALAWAAFNTATAQDAGDKKPALITVLVPADARVEFDGTKTTSTGGKRVYVSGDNLLLFTPYTGYDPEVFVDAGVGTRGIDYLTYPRARTFTTGVRLSF